MKRGLSIALSTVVWVIIVFYLLWAGRLGKDLRSEVTVGEVSVLVKDSSDINIIRASDVKRWINAAGLDPVGKHIDSVDLSSIAYVVSSRDFVKQANASVDLEGVLTVSLSQREPVLRVITENGYDFYYTADGYVVPAGRHSAHYVPVVTGSFGLPFANSFSGNLEDMIADSEKKSAENYIFLCKLINFVKYIGNNDFWNAQIVQINVLNGYKSTSGVYHEPEIELIPRVGDHVVLFGEIDGYRQRLDKLLAFYKKALSHEGWDKWSYIDVRFDGQVVCSNR